MAIQIVHELGQLMNIAINRLHQGYNKKEVSGGVTSEKRCSPPFLFLLLISSIKYLL